MAAAGTQSCFLHAAVQRAGGPNPTSPTLRNLFPHRSGPAHHNGGYDMQTQRIHMAHSCFSLEAGRQNQRYPDGHRRLASSGQPPSSITDLP